jgi:hypothetical protein
MHVKIYKTIILPLAFYGCGTWCLILTGEHRLRVFGKRVLRSIFGLKRNEIIGRWKNYILRSSITSALRHIKLCLSRKRPLGTTTFRCKDNIKMGLIEKSDGVV